MTNQQTPKTSSPTPDHHPSPDQPTDPRVCSPDREYSPAPTPVMDALREAAKRTKTLLSFQFNVTERCNLKCRHCYRAPEQVSPCPDPTTQQVVDIMQQANSMGALFCAFSGGEPLLRRDWPELFQEARRLKMGVTLMTNGTLLNEKNLKTLIDLNPGRVQISLYGATPQTHDHLTNTPGSFEKASCAAEALAKAGVRVTVASVITRQNAGEISTLFNWAHSIGANPTINLRVMPGLDGNYCEHSVRPKEEQLPQLFHIPELRYIIEPRKNKAETTETTENTETTEIDKESNQEQSWDDLPYCRSGETSICINADLTVWPCASLAVELGNLKTNTLSEIWKDHPYIKHFQTFRRGKDLKDECRVCEYRASCSRCPGAAMLTGNDIHGKEPEYCKTARVVHKIKNTMQNKYIDPTPGSSHIIDRLTPNNFTPPISEKKGAL